MNSMSSLKYFKRHLKRKKKKTILGALSSKETTSKCSERNLAQSPTAWSVFFSNCWREGEMTVMIFRGGLGRPEEQISRWPLADRPSPVGPPCCAQQILYHQGNTWRTSLKTCLSFAVTSVISVFREQLCHRGCPGRNPRITIVN